MPGSDPRESKLFVYGLHGDHRGLMAAVVAITLAVGGFGVIGFGVASQQEAPQPQHRANGHSTLAGDRSGVDHPAVPHSQGAAGPAGSERAVGRIMPRSKPVALSIPSIGVRSVVRHLGETDTGALEVPTPGPHYDEAAWYRYSPTPGSLGPAIILGHIDSAANGPSVFFRLGEMRRGDRIVVTRSDGSIARFIVDAVQSFSKSAFPTERVYGDIDHAGLRILTCGGPFDSATGHYLRNIVVFASLRT